MTYEDDTLVDIEPSLVIRYLQNTGWRLENCRNNVKRIFLDETGPGDPVEVFLTESRSERDRKREIYFALKTIAQLYDKAVTIISREIRSLAYDVIASRIPNEHVRNDSIDLRIASEYVKGVKAFLASAATTEMSGERFFRRTRKEAIDYAERCRFGHTFRGSFGFLIESPVGLNLEPTIAVVSEVVPFERRVVERIVRGLSAYAQAVTEQDPSIMTQAADGFSANMCDCMADIVEAMDVARIDMAIAFSPEWKASVRAGGNPSFAVEFRHLDVLRDAARSLRSDEGPLRSNVFGRVKRLETDGNPSDLLEDQAQREIEINWVNAEDELAHVRMALTPKDYLNAVEAHRSGSAVSASGMLVRKGRSWQLTEVENFKVITL